MNSIEKYILELEYIKSKALIIDSIISTHNKEGKFNYNGTELLNVEYEFKLNDISFSFIKYETYLSISIFNRHIRIVSSYLYDMGYNTCILSDHHSNKYFPKSLYDSLNDLISQLIEGIN